MKIKTGVMTIPGAPLQGLNPLPAFRKHKAGVSNVDETVPERLKENLGTTVKVLPYLVQDRYSRDRVAMQIKTCVLENRYLKATFWPEYGGRLYSLFDKTENRELLMTNTVFQPANLAIRNAWLSGGVEWNIGSLGHTYTTCDHVFAAVLQDNEGSDFLRIYEYERCTGVFWQVDFHLPEDSQSLICHVKIVNPYKEDTTTYWWSNTAVPDTGGTRVLASCQDVLLACGGKLSYKKLPYVEEIPGVDLSYPSQMSRGFDYFFQPEDGVETAWEAAAYEDGLVFFETSTAPLLYRKVFGWGNHHAGKHWQEFLSEEGKGYYIEVQAGFARSQMHDKLLKADGTLEWTQCFSRFRGDRQLLHGTGLKEANAYAQQQIDRILDRQTLAQIDAKCREHALRKVLPHQLVHTGSGFGALEILRMELQKDGTVPENLCFPASTLGPEQYPWLHLLQNGILPELSPASVPQSYMTGPKWYRLIADSVEKAGGRHWFSLLHLGVALYELTDTTKIATEAEKWEHRQSCDEKARQAWMDSAAMVPSVWAYRNLAVWEQARGNTEAAEGYFEKIAEIGFLDFALAVEYMKLLNSVEKYEKTWAVYKRLPEQMQQKDRLMILAAKAALELRNLPFLEDFFRRGHCDIREGENSLTDMWFAYSALQLAKARNIPEPEGEVLEQLKEEAWDLCPPPKEIDFRMSLTKKNKYRVEE